MKRLKPTIQFSMGLCLLVIVILSQMFYFTPINALLYNVEDPKGIRLNIPGDPRSNIAISWYTNSLTESCVRYGLAYDNLNQIVSSPETVENIGDTFIHHVKLSNLSTNTTYYYQVGGTSSRWSQVYNFTTAPERNSTSLHFIAYGDNRSNRKLRRLINRLVLQNMTTYHSEPVRFVMNNGDMVSSGNKHELFNYFFDDCQMLFEKVPILPIQGNHEFGDLGGSYYREQFVLPENGNKEWYWALQYGSAFIMGLDSEKHGIVPYDSQSLPWISSVLEKSAQESTVLWRFAMFHQPPFVSSSHISRTDIRESWCPVFDNHGVDLVFNGHCHQYERSFPVSFNGSLPTNESYDYQNPNFPIYIVTGAAGMGGPIDRVAERDNNFMVLSNFTWHYVDVFISNNYTNKLSKLSAKVVGIIPQYLTNGSVDEFDLSKTVLLDNFTITKDIPDSYFETSQNISYNDIFDFEKQRIYGYTISAILFITLIGIDIWIIRKRRKFVRSLV